MIYQEEASINPKGLHEDDVSYSLLATLRWIRASIRAGCHASNVYHMKMDKKLMIDWTDDQFQGGGSSVPSWYNNISL